MLFYSHVYVHAWPRDSVILLGRLRHGPEVKFFIFAVDLFWTARHEHYDTLILCYSFSFSTHVVSPAVVASDISAVWVFAAALFISWLTETSFLIDCFIFVRRTSILQRINIFVACPVPNRYHRAASRPVCPTRLEARDCHCHMDVESEHRSHVTG